MSRVIAALIPFLLVGVPALGQRVPQIVTQHTTGNCSPAVVAGASVTITCRNLDPALVTSLHQVLTRLNAIAGNQLDQKAVSKTLNDIKDLLSQGTVSSQAVTEGVKTGVEQVIQEQKQELESDRNNPKTLAQSSYSLISRFLGMLQAVNPSGTPLGLEPADPNAVMMRSYHAKYDVLLPDTLKNLESRGHHVHALIALSSSLTSLDDIRKLADGFGQIDDASAHYMYLQLTRFLSKSGTMRNALLQQSNQKLQIYRASYADTISGNLKKLQAQHVPVDELIKIQDNLNSPDDLQRLADGFKKLADSLTP